MNLKLSHNENGRFSGHSVKCKACKIYKLFHAFSPCENSDNGLFPYCDHCVSILKGTHELNFKRYRSIH